MDPKFVEQQQYSTAVMMK